MNIDKSFKSEADIIASLENAFFGGMAKPVKIKYKDNELLFIVGQPTSGLTSSKILVFKKFKNKLDSKETKFEYKLYYYRSTIRGSVNIVNKNDCVDILLEDKKIFTIYKIESWDINI